MTEEKPKRTALGYYQFASVVLLLIMVGFTISGFWGLVRIAIPNLTVVGYEWKRVSTLDRYIEAEYREESGLYYRMGRVEKNDRAKTGGLTRAQVEDKWETAKEDTLYEERRGGLQQILFWFVAVVVCLPLYLYHHKAVKKARQMMEQAAGQ